MAEFRTPDGHATRYRTAGGGTLLSFPPGRKLPHGAVLLERVPFWLGTPGEVAAAPIDMVLYCPKCGHQHIDAPEEDAAYSTRLFESAWWELGGDKPARLMNPPHRTHECHACRWRWRPADVYTRGVPVLKTRGGEQTLPCIVHAADARVPAVAETMLLGMLRCFHQPNPENPRDWRVAAGKAHALAQEVNRAHHALGELAHAVATRPPSLEALAAIERPSLDEKP